MAYVLPEATDEDGDTLTYEASDLPMYAHFNPSTRTLSWSNPSYGEYVISFIVHDDGRPMMSDVEQIRLRVNPSGAGAAAPPRHPVLAPIGPQLVSQGQTISIQLSATDPDGGTLTYTAGAAEDKTPPSSYTFNSGTGAFTWNTASVEPGNYYLVFGVSDSTSPTHLTDTEEVTITVGDVNRPPVLDHIGYRWADEGEVIVFTATATDPENDDLTYTVEDPLNDVPYPPPGFTFDQETQTFTWTASNSGSGFYVVRVRVTDSDGESDFEDVRIEML